MASAPASPSRTDRRRARIRRRLLDAGRELIAARGVAGLTVGELTETADVGRGSFYNHFADKEAFVTAIGQELIAEVAARAAAAPEPEADPASRASRADQEFIGLAVDDPSRARLIVNLASDSSLFAEAVRPYARPILQAGLDAGRFAVDDLDMALLVLQSSALEVMRGLLDGTASRDAPTRHAAAMLRLFGLPAAEASAIAAGPPRSAGVRRFSPG